MSNHVDQNNLSLINIPPSRANAKITLPIVSAQVVSADLRKLGLTASDLKPIDWRKKAKLSHVRNQANCGDCWAQSSTGALTDRFIIHKEIENLDLSSLLTTQCVPQTLNKGCGGGSPSAAGTYFEESGAVDSSEGCESWGDFCKPETGCGHGLDCKGVSCAMSASKPECHKACTPQVPNCAEISKTCFSNAKYVYKAKKGSTRSTASTDNSATIARMKHELMDGPYVVSYMVAKDFMGPAIGYKWEKTNGIYINGEYNDELHDKAPAYLKKSLKVTGPRDWADIIIEGYMTQGGKPVPAPAAHAVELVGWDIGYAGPKYGKIPYWIVKNSWGADWNEEGYFKIAINDPDSKHPGLNAYLGLDIPVKNFVQASTGKVLGSLGGAFGSGTVFDPDMNSGAPKKHQYTPKKKPDNKKKESKKNIGKILLYIFIGLIIGGVILYFLTRNSNGKRGGKRGRKGSKKGGRKGGKSRR